MGFVRSVCTELWLSGFGHGVRRSGPRWSDQQFRGARVVVLWRVVVMLSVYPPAGDAQESMLQIRPAVQLIWILCLLVMGVSEVGREPGRGSNFQNGGFVFIQITFL